MQIYSFPLVVYSWQRDDCNHMRKTWISLKSDAHRKQYVNVSKSMDIEGKLKREGSCSQAPIDYLLPCKLLQLGLQAQL